MKYAIISMILIVLAVVLFMVLPRQDTVTMHSKVSSDSIQVLVDEEYQDMFIKGVNIGATKPGSFPGELAISHDEYFRWFGMIKEMNANTIRVYTILSPAFYNALYEFNQTQTEPLYFMQGVWVNEEDVAEINDVYGNDNTIKSNFIADSKSAINVIHGNGELPIRLGFASGTYDKDVSMYMIGWILGIEWYPELVINTNELNSEKTPLEGEYVYNTVNSSPFEIFLAEIAEEVIAYEVDNYNSMRPLSFVNWLSTDPLSHPNEPHVNEDIVEVDTEHIKAQDSYTAGLFASYHIYPYFPEFMNYSIEYNQYIDDDGNINPYKAYLEDLKAHHSMPIVVAEFGIPASRGKAHDSLNTGFNQGNNTEAMQGEMVVSMAEDIYETGYAGALIFSWQDEWFKRTWNTNQFDLSYQRPFWSNIQTNEQYFGLLAFEPGLNQRISYADGDISEWLQEDLISTHNNLEISIKSDERYLYIMIESPGIISDEDTIYIGIDTIQNQGNDHMNNTNITFNKNADFIIQINGSDNSRIMVDQYYDAFQYLYTNQFEFLDSIDGENLKNTGIFDPMYLALSYQLHLPQEDITIPFLRYETGFLKIGNGNPSSTLYNSLTDFSINGKYIELQIPWQLLNFMDPSTKAVMSDFRLEEWKSNHSINTLSIGAVLSNSDTDAFQVLFEDYQLQAWGLPVFHERLKESYYIVQSYFLEIG